MKVQGVFEKGIVYFRNNGADSSLTPVKPRLGRFLDVYSPEHLNITPKPVSKHNNSGINSILFKSNMIKTLQKSKHIFAGTRNASPNLLTPEKFSEVEFKCRYVYKSQLIQMSNVYEKAS